MRTTQFHDPEPRRPSQRQKARSRWRDHSRRKAPVFSDKQIRRVERYIERFSNATHSDRLKFYLSVYAGLRVGEITDLRIDDLLEKDGSIAKHVRVPAAIAKGKKARSIPMHPKIEQAIGLFLAHYPDVPFVSFSRRWHEPKKQTLTALTNYFPELYKKAGLEGFSSHSGRRTFITNLARTINGTTFTLRDVQKLAGHANLATTEVYIEESGNLEQLVRRLK